MPAVKENRHRPGSVTTKLPFHGSKVVVSTVYKSKFNALYIDKEFGS